MTKRPVGANLILKAIEVLGIVGSAASPPRLTDVVRSTGMPTGTAHRILETLAAERLLRRDEVTRTYRLGPRLLQLARGAWEDLDVRAAASPELSTLQASLGQTLMLAILVDGALIVIECRHAKDAVRSAPGIGSSLLMHCTAAGKAVLSACDPQEAGLIDTTELRPVTSRTITDAMTLRAHLELAASQHYAIDDEESALGIRGCAAPIRNQQGQALAAIAFSGPAELVSLDRCREVGARLAAAAERIAWNLGYNPPERWADVATGRRGEPVARVGSAIAFVGTNPVWSKARDGLFWSDRTRPALRFNGADGTERCVDLPAPAHGLMENGASMLLLMPDGLHRLDLERESLQPIDALVGSEPHLRYVTGRCDAVGRPWITTMDRTLSRANGRLYRIDPDFSAHCMADGLLFPLGLGWSPDNEWIYFSDGPARQIYRAPFDLAAGTLGERTVFAQIPQGRGRPTGIAVDREGFVWNTLSEGWQVTRYAPDGRIDHVLQLPVSRPIDCGFGGESLRTLYITTARQGIPERRLHEVPLSGALLAYETSTPGIGPHPFGSPAR